MTKRAILFDLDGTLLDTAPDLVVAVNALRNDFNLPSLAFERVRSMVGKGARNLISRVLNFEQKIEFDLDQAYARFAKHYHTVNGHKTQEFIGVTETLKKLHEKGYPMAIVTNKPSEFTLPLIAQFGWNDFFGSIVCGDTLPIRKPHPEPLLHALQALNNSAENALMIGDSMNDALAARAAQCQCVMLDYGYNEGESVHESLKDWDNVPIFSDFCTAIESTVLYT